MTTLVTIHGAWATKKSFNYVVNHIHTYKDDGLDVHNFEYDSIDPPIGGLHHISDEMYGKLGSLRNDVVIIGHSMGGILALSLEKHPNVKKVITVSSPISGIVMNNMIKTFLTVRAPLLSHAMAGSSFIDSIKNQVYTKPVVNIVTTRGFNPAVFEQSDGVVTVNSQTSWAPSTSKLYTIQDSHHEVLQSDELCKIVKDELYDNSYRFEDIIDNGITTVNPETVRTFLLGKYAKNASKSKQ